VKASNPIKKSHNSLLLQKIFLEGAFGLKWNICGENYTTVLKKTEEILNQVFQCNFISSISRLGI
jgi:hypothetical protein